MREILFRGKRIDTGEWVYGDFMNDWSHLNTKSQKVIHNNIMKYKVIPETIGQYTGLTDKNGSKIFEGDIVRVEYTGVNKGLEGIAKVVFDNCKFSLLWGWHRELICLSDFCNVTFEVIGNIHDNPELLKEVD